MSIFYYFVVTILKAIFKIFYRHKVYGLEHLIGGPAIIAPNHVSYLDPPLIAVSSSEEITFLAKKSLFSNKFFSKLIRSLHAYPLNGTPQDLSSFKLICHLLQNHKKVLIFPEGLRTWDGKLAPLKSGIGMLAQRSNAPVIPVYIYGTFEIWNRSRKFPKLLGKTACVFGSPIFPKKYSDMPKKEAQEAIALEVSKSITQLRLWYESGAKGTPP